MKLWTVQPVEVFDLLMDTGTFRCDKTKATYLIDEYSFEKPYNWLVERMKEKVGEPPEGVEYPIWAWHTRYDKHKKPDLRNIGLGTRGEESVCIEFEIPDNEVLLSDFDFWHFVLNDMYFGDSISDEDFEKESEWFDSLPKEEQRRLKKESWNKIFDMDYVATLRGSSGAFIQATFWELKKEYVTNYWKFKAR